MFRCSPHSLQEIAIFGVILSAIHAAIFLPPTIEMKDPLIIDNEVPNRSVFQVFLDAQYVLKNVCRMRNGAELEHICLSLVSGKQGEECHHIGLVHSNISHQAINFSSFM